MAKKMYVDEAIADAIHTMEQQTQDIDFEHRETTKKVSMADNAIRDLTERFRGLDTEFPQVDRLQADLTGRMDKLSSLPGKVEALESRIVGMAEGLDLEDKRRDGENWEMERRWAEELGGVETPLEEKMDERLEEQDRKLLERQSANMVDFHSYVDESLKRLHTEIQQDWWIVELEHCEKVRNEEMKMLLKQRPTHDEISESYTTLATTSRVINQVAELHTKTGREHHLLQSGLNTLEQLYLRQLDSSAEIVRSSLIHIFKLY